MAGEPEVPGWWIPYADEFPRWQAWIANNGLLYARKTGATPGLMVRGEDAVDLRDEIIRAEARAEASEAEG